MSRVDLDVSNSGMEKQLNKNLGVWDHLYNGRKELIITPDKNQKHQKSCSEFVKKVIDWYHESQEGKQYKGKFDTIVFSGFTFGPQIQNPTGLQGFLLNEVELDLSLKISFEKCDFFCYLIRDVELNSLVFELCNFNNGLDIHGPDFSHGSFELNLTINFLTFKDCRCSGENEISIFNVKIDILLANFKSCPKLNVGYFIDHYEGKIEMTYATISGSISLIQFNSQSVCKNIVFGADYDELLISNSNFLFFKLIFPNKSQLYGLTKFTKLSVEHSFSIYLGLNDKKLTLNNCDFSRCSIGNGTNDDLYVQSHFLNKSIYEQTATKRPVTMTEKGVMDEKGAESREEFWRLLKISAKKFDNRFLELKYGDNELKMYALKKGFINKFVITIFDFTILVGLLTIFFTVNGVQYFSFPIYTLSLASSIDLIQSGMFTVDVLFISKVILLLFLCTCITLLSINRNDDQDLFLFKIHYLLSDHGRNWFKAVGAYLLGMLVLYVLLVHFSTSNLADQVASLSFFKYLNFFESDVKDIVIEGTILKNLGMANIFLYLGKVRSAIMYYQITISFRKFTRSS